MLNPKVPPHSEEAEKSVIGAILLDSEAIVKVAEFLRPEHFYDPSHQSIFAAELSLYEDRSPIDLVTVSDKLGRQYPKLCKIGQRLFYQTGISPAFRGNVYLCLG